MAQRSTLRPGEKVNKFTILKIIGLGGFGEVYLVESDKKQFAMKFQGGDEEQTEILKQEGVILKALTGRPNIPKFEASFSSSLGIFLIMELLDIDMDGVKKQIPGTKFSMSTWSRVAIQMLFGVKTVNDLGFIHRDIKPANFCVKVSDRQIKLIDFGLMRRFVESPDSDPAFRVARPSAALRGTPMYTSINGHRGKELGRADDVMSLIYTVSALLKNLPWQNLNETDVEAVKEQCSLFRLFEEGMSGMITAEMRKILESMDKDLKRTDVYGFPPYGKLYQFLSQVVIRANGKWEEKYDWESEKPKVRGPVGPWENPGMFFQADRWQKLKVPGSK